jgi:hypothetical protein
MDGGMCPVIIGGEVYFKPMCEDFDRVGRDHVGEALAVSVYLRGRSLTEHKRYRAILRHAVHSLKRPDGTEYYTITSKAAEARAIEALHYILRCKTGFTKTVTDPATGKEYTGPESTDFTVSEDKVSKYRDVAYTVLAELLGCKVRDLMLMGVE